MGKSAYSGWFNFIENYWFNRCIELSNLRSYQMLQSNNWHCLVAVILLSSQGDTCCKITNASNGWVESIRGRCFRIISGTCRGKLPLKCEWMLLPSQKLLLFITYNFRFPTTTVPKPKECLQMMGAWFELAPSLHKPCSNAIERPGEWNDTETSPSKINIDCFSITWQASVKLWWNERKLCMKTEFNWPRNISPPPCPPWRQRFSKFQRTTS